MDDGLIAFLVAVLVVDFLEAVQVEHSHGEGRPALSDAVVDGFHVILVSGPVAKAGEPIDIRLGAHQGNLVAQLLFQGTDLVAQLHHFVVGRSFRLFLVQIDFDARGGFVHQGFDAVGHVVHFVQHQVELFPVLCGDQRDDDPREN